MNIIEKWQKVGRQKVMADRDLAALYGVETRVLKQAVKRNPERFPKEFMFQLDNQEFEKWRSQIVMSNSDKMGFAETEARYEEERRKKNEDTK